MLLPAVLGALFAAPEVPPSPPLPAREVTLASWGLESIDDLGYARIGVLEGERPTLVVYHLDHGDPAKRRVDEGKHAPPPLSDGELAVTTPGVNRNTFGWTFNGFARAPATAAVTLEDGALAFAYSRAPGTFAGFWLQLFDGRVPRDERVYLDASGLGWLTFEVRGDAGGEVVQLAVADMEWERREDSVAVGEIGALLPSGRIETTWQRVWLPLDMLDAPQRRLDRSRLASLVMLADPAGGKPSTGRIEVRGVTLTREKRDEPALVVKTTEPPEVKRTRKAMWLWETRRLLAAEGEVERLADFARAHAFTDLFVQIPFEGPERWSPEWDRAGMERLNTALHAVGVRVHALDGAPEYARPEWHERVAATVASLGAFNAAVPEAARFWGVRFDVEPYLLPEWQGHAREDVLASYRDLLVKLATAAHAGGLVFGVDIPFWLDGRDEVTGEPAASLGGRSALEVVIDIADNVGVMDYRTVAFGADGVLSHGEGELAYASAHGKQVFVGLETVHLPDELISSWVAGGRLANDGTGDLVIEPLGGGRARLTWVPAAEKSADGRYPWAVKGARVLRQRDGIQVPATKLTFADLGADALERVMAQARPVLAQSPSFAGFIVHSYESYRPLVERQ